MRALLSNKNVMFYFLKKVNNSIATKVRATLLKKHKIFLKYFSERHN